MNLLPNTEKESLRKGLKLRFITVALLLLTASFLAGLIMLSPSYFLALGNFSKIEPVDYFLGTENENLVKEILRLPGEIDIKIKFLQSNLASLSAVNILYKVAESVPEGVTLNSISSSRDQSYKEKKGLLVLISGIAADRDSLMSFSALLKKSNTFSLVDVPVSSLTKDKNLPFSMKIFVENKK